MLYFLPLRQLRAFTLTELLITLLITGLISVLALPNVFKSQKEKKYNALMKASILSASDLLENAFTMGETNLMNEAVVHLPTLRNCGATVGANTLTATGLGCWTTSSQGALPTGVTNEGVILKNGVTLVGLKSAVISTDETLSFKIDVNGTDGPNLDNKDQITLVACTTAAFCGSNATMTGLLADGFNVGPGILLPANADSILFYNRLFNQ